MHTFTDFFLQVENHVLMAICTVFNYSVDYTDFRYIYSILLLIEKAQVELKCLSSLIVMSFTLQRCVVNCKSKH